MLSLDDDRVVMAVGLRAAITRVGLFKLSFAMPEGLEIEALPGATLSRVSNANALDDASNEDARVQLRNLKTQQTVLGLNTRRQRLYLDNRTDTARECGKTLLVLDTVTGSTASRLYERLGWTRVGDVPAFALLPEGGFCSTTIYYRKLG